MKRSVLIFAFIFSAMNLAFAAPLPSTWDGTARVIDGDTISIRDRRVRLAAIDACEISQEGRRNGDVWPCGRAARSYLAQMIDGRHVRCLVIDQDQYGRLVGKCFHQGRDIGLDMVAAGMAETLLEYLPSGNPIDTALYRSAEASARSRMLGVWSAEIERPRDYRRSSSGQSR